MHRPYDFDVLDLFAGIGVGVALRRLGLTEFGLDFDRDVVRLRNAHGMPTALVDLWTFQPEHLVLKFEGLHASPSCKKWSAAGLKEAHSEISRILAAAPAVADGKPLSRVLRDMDPEAALVLAPLAWVAHHRPVWVTLEQVTSVQPVWDAIAVELEKFGYSVDTGKLHAEQYGVPQTRHRSILVANRTRTVRLPEPTHSRYYPRNKEKVDPGLPPPVRMAEALGWESLPAGNANPEKGGGNVVLRSSEAEGPAPASPSKADRNKWAQLDGGQAVRPAWPSERPSTTIVGSFRPEIVAAPGYRKAGDGPRQNAPDSVRVTLDEASQLQSFPPNFDYSAISKSAGRRIVGNACPPLLMEHVIRAARGA